MLSTGSGKTSTGQNKPSVVLSLVLNPVAILENYHARQTGRGHEEDRCESKQIWETGQQQPAQKMR
jgi:hypothetical protein